MHNLRLSKQIQVSALIVFTALMVSLGMMFATDSRTALAQTGGTYVQTQTGYTWGGDTTCINNNHKWNDCTYTCGPGYAGATCSIGRCRGHQDGGPMGGGNLGVTWEIISYTCVYTPPACTADSSCAANTCTTGTCTDSCGNSYAGTKSCAVSCTATNACGVSNTGTLSGGVCSASAPALPSGYGNSCISAANSCGMTSGGIIGCSGSCSASIPSESLCPTYSQGSYYAQSSYYSQSSYVPAGCTAPSVNISAAPSRVRSGQTTTLTVIGTGISSSCTVTGSGVNTTIPASSCNATQTITTPAITARTIYTVSCDSGAATAQVIVNIPFGIIEF